jgi:hypothetical protein
MKNHQLRPVPVDNRYGQVPRIGDEFIIPGRYRPIIKSVLDVKRYSRKKKCWEVIGWSSMRWVKAHYFLKYQKVQTHARPDEVIRWKIARLRRVP